MASRAGPRRSDGLPSSNVAFGRERAGKHGIGRAAMSAAEAARDAELAQAEAEAPSAAEQARDEAEAARAAEQAREASEAAAQERVGAEEVLEMYPDGFNVWSQRANQLPCSQLLIFRTPEMMDVGHPGAPSVPPAGAPQAAPLHPAPAGHGRGEKRFGASLALPLPKMAFDFSTGRRRGVPMDQSQHRFLEGVRERIALIRRDTHDFSPVVVEMDRVKGKGAGLEHDDVCRRGDDLAYADHWRAPLCAANLHAIVATLVRGAEPDHHVVLTKLKLSVVASRLDKWKRQIAYNETVEYITGYERAKLGRQKNACAWTRGIIGFFLATIGIIPDAAPGTEYNLDVPRDRKVSDSVTWVSVQGGDQHAGIPFVYAVSNDGKTIAYPIDNELLRVPYRVPCAKRENAEIYERERKIWMGDVE